MRGPLTVMVELLAAVPSVVYGLWGIFFLAPKLQGPERWFSDTFSFLPFVGGTVSIPNYFVAGLILVACFALWERRLAGRGGDTLVDLTMLRLPQLRAGLGTMAVMFLCLGGIFFQWFQRQFPDPEKFRKDVRPSLRAILAARRRKGRDKLSA